ncbi:hypothetical protein DT603_12430 [Pseudoxanthomonas gei]|uniref:Uncharacterized protein n=1 Tax=Pseudoxanthomonas gei TaxID=1383030 RepID=A0ABX0AFK0_9GAMM|nr:hypothetical protein [Pseudoxanthomonas gei]NDK39648.1 hypothetical protein [Pseudoxanthomonas gei]
MALWLLLAGPADVLGVDAGKLGMAVLVTTAWLSLYAVSRLPRGQLEAVVSPGEWRAWVGFGFTLVAIVYFLSQVPVFEQNGAGASAVARNLVMLLVAWLLLSSVMGSRWKGAVQQDERDLEIEKKASARGRSALVFVVIALAVMLGFSPADRLQWATHFMIANLLVCALMWGWLCEYAATVLLYWRDRR